MTMSLYRKPNPSPYADSLLVEARGLELLAKTLAEAGIEAIRVPRVHSVSEQELVLERVDAGPGSEAQMAALGAGLAQLHQIGQGQFGLDYDNYIGLSPQPNQVSGDWGTFFADCRLGFQVGQIKDLEVQVEFASVLERQRSLLIDFLNAHCTAPSLLHGDLWSGNVLYDRQSVWLIDPAVYYGDREADVAMTELFGGFSAPFYDSYDERFPRTQAYPLKRSIYNLYHTLNHYNLFGAGYLAACRRNLRAIQSLS